MKRKLIPVFFRGIRRMTNGSYKNSKNRIGDIIKLVTSNREYKVFKQSELQAHNSENQVYFEIEFQFKSWVPKCFSPTIPFFLGMPGFVSKLWLMGKEHNEYAGQYIFETKEDAFNYGNSSAQKLIKSMCIQDRYKWQVIQN